MRTDRRTFLIQTGGAAAILTTLGCDDVISSPPSPPSQGSSPPPPTRKPKSLIGALERIKTENKPGIAIRIPTDKKRRHDPGHDLIHFLNQDNAEWRELFAEVVLVCLDSDILQDHILQANSDHDLVLFNEESQATAGIPFSFAEQWERLPMALLSLAHGPTGSRLMDRAAAIRKKLEPSVLEVLDRLAAPKTDLEADKAALLKEAPKMVPLLVQARLNAGTPEKAKALGEVIEAYVRSSNRTVAGPQLPYGLEAGAYAGGCGLDPCRERPPDDGRLGVACGMALVPPNARDFIRYLTQ